MLHIPITLELAVPAWLAVDGLARPLRGRGLELWVLLDRGRAWGEWTGVFETRLGRRARGGMIAGALRRRRVALHGQRQCGQRDSSEA
jgi:hypothetical protein